jgi:hypothetical protein
MCGHVRPCTASLMSTVEGRGAAARALGATTQPPARRPSLLRRSMIKHGEEGISVVRHFPRRAPPSAGLLFLALARRAAKQGGAGKRRAGLQHGRRGITGAQQMQPRREPQAGVCTRVLCSCPGARAEVRGDGARGNLEERGCQPTQRGPFSGRPRGPCKPRSHY